MIKGKLLFTIIALLSVHQAFSQSAERRLGIELSGGINEYQGDLGSAIFFARTPNYQGIGYSLSYYLNPNIDLAFFGSGGDVGFYSVIPNVIPENTYAFFRTNLFTVNGGIRFKLLKDKPFTPYIMLGGGGVYLHSNVSRDPNSYTGAAGNVAAGFGFQYSVNEKLGFRLQSMFNYTFNDIWDGEPYAYLVHTRNKNNDMFAFHSLGIFYNLEFGESTGGDMGGKSLPDKDKDGVPNKSDLCPKTQPWELPVNDDGCPRDSDLDTIPDYQDSCPYQFGPRKFNGCPDKDNDGIIDSKDRCPEKAGPAEFGGCPDTDGDGIIDIEDQCPSQKGLKQFNGCPDTDGDGIEDRKDKCPEVAGPAAGEGCPDTDGDGVYDNKDVCVKVAGPASNKGCPEIKQEVVQRIALAAKGINFETGSDKILAESFDDLDALVKILNEYPEAKVAIDGHTDNVGDPATNKELSQKRADAVKAYLVSKGVDASRLTATGYGDTQPIADNKTKQGRAKNRRVDFKLSY
ncbi:MAG TPA: OmpA family protein [Bacteroidia bacterium]